MRPRPDESDAPKGAAHGLRQAFALLLLVACIWSAPAMLLRKVRTVGSRYVCWHYLVGALLGPVFCQVVDPAGWSPPVVVFAGVLLAVLVLHRVKHDRHAHSQFCGESALGRGARAYTVYEPAVLTATGVALILIPLCPALGAYLIGAGVSSGLFHSHLEARDAARLRAMNDAMREQAAFMEQFSERYRRE